MKVKSNYYHLSLLLIITIIGMVIRVIGLYHCPFTHDELSVVTRLHYTHFADLIKDGVMYEGHPAGVQVFLWWWSHLFGISEWSLRLPFLLMGIAAIPLMYAVTKVWYNQTAGLFAAAVLAVSQYTVYYSLLARPYIAGLFFILLALYYWSLFMIKKEYSIKNIFLFALFAAICAYIHQFAMMTAFLIGLSGLIFINKNNCIKYLIACVIAVILYLPHLPITIHQLGLKGVGSWLSVPDGSFFVLYAQYLFHFSWLTALLVIVAFLVASSFNKQQLSDNYKKIILSLILFVLPMMIGYVYSIKVDPVLQKSCLIFSFPFLLLFCCSLINEKLSLRGTISLSVVTLSLLLSLILVRHYKKIADNSYYEYAYTQAVDSRLAGGSTVDCMLNMRSGFSDYYDNKYKTHLFNHYPTGDHQEKDYYQQLSSCKSSYLLAAGLSDNELWITRHFYPYIIKYKEFTGSEVYLFSKNNQHAINPMPLIMEKDFTLKDYHHSDTYYSLLSCPLSDITNSRFTKLDITFDYYTQDLSEDFLIVVETRKNDEIIDWRSASTKNFFLEQDSIFTIFLPLRYEMLIKNSNHLQDYSINIFLWNINNTTKVTPKHCRITARKDNHLIYALEESTK